MKRRLDLAAALVHEPKIVFLDEPTTGLDPIGREAIWRYVEALNKDEGVTFFLTTQYLEEADRLAHEVAIVDRGRIVAEGSPEELKATIGTDVVTVKVPSGDEHAARAAEVLGRLDGASEVRAVGDSVVIYIKDGSAAISPIVLRLSEASIPVQEVTLARPTLDDVFLRKTGLPHRERDAGGGAGRNEEPMSTATSTYYLMARALRESARQPGVEVQNLFIPIFFLFVTVGAIGEVSASAFGVDNYKGFQLPVAILQGAAGAAGMGGFGMVMDIDRGYFDKLMLTPAPRLALVFGRMAADGVRVTALSAVILVVGLIIGSGMESGPLGAVVFVLIAGLFGLAYSGIGMSIALRTGSVQAAQAGFLIFFPLLFLSPAFAPKEVFSGWLELLATLNPVTYILEGLRSLVLEGWDFEALAYALLAILGLGALTMTLTLLALRSRTA